MPTQNSSHRLSTSRLHLAKKSRKPKDLQSSKKRLPRLVVFDLDGCLWRPELFEILTCPRDNRGPPFSLNERDEIPGTTLKSAGGGHTLKLLGDTRSILTELYYQEDWYPTLVGISSRTDPPEWAHELLEKFSIYDEQGKPTLPHIAMKEVFTPQLCLLDKAMDKASQFEILLKRANGILPTAKNSQQLQFKDVIFFDNEAGNCKQVARLGVTSVYTPKGVTREAWENGLTNFPSSRVLGPKLPY